MTHAEKIGRWLAGRRLGVEIGAGSHPLPGLTPFYVDRFAEFGGERCRADFQGDATRLPFRDNSLDYVATSHVLEHVANPVAALMEWYRVLRPGGRIYLVVPDRRRTWDHSRALTPVTHFLEDFTRGTTAVDPTHVDDFVDNVDWSTYSPATPPAEVPAKKSEMKRIYHGTVNDGVEINIHFHVFELSNLVALLETLATWPRTRCRWSIVDRAENFPSDCPNGCLVVIEVQKTWRDRLAGLGERWRCRGDVRRVLTADARPFATAG